MDALLNDLLNNGADDEQVIDPADPPAASMMPAPPFITTDNAQEAIEFAQNWAKDHGYALAIRRRNKGRDGIVEAYYLACDRGRAYQPYQPHETSLRQNTSTRRMECPFNVSVTYSRTFENWTLKIRDPEHNHGPSPASTHPVLRRLELNRKKERIRTLSEQGLGVRHILANIQSESGEETSLQRRDLYNYRQQLNRDFLQGRTPLQALLTVMPESGWIVRRATEDDHVVSLFCTHKSCLELLRTNPYIVFLDCTYKTNKYRMPLLDIVGSTATNKTFFIGFGFVKNEQEGSYKFILSSLRDIYRQLELPIPYPVTVMTDKDQALLNAIDAEYPTANRMICEWHINKNIVSQAKPAIAQTLLANPNMRRGNPEYQAQLDKSWDTMLSDWKKVVYAPTENEKNQAWDNVATEYAEYGAVIDYIQHEWLEPTTARMFLTCYTKNYLHFGNKATSRVEAAHRLLKRDIDVSTRDLLSTVKAIGQTVEARHLDVRQGLESDKVLTRRSLQTTLFRDVIHKVSSHALFKVLGIYNDYLPAGQPGRRPMAPCTHTTTTTLGIPCIHTIRQYAWAHQSLSMADFHPHWHLVPQLTVPIDTRLLVLDPVVVRTRGRPRGAANRPNREPSAFEYVERQVTGNR